MDHLISNLLVISNLPLDIFLQLDRLETYLSRFGQLEQLVSAPSQLRVLVIFTETADAATAYLSIHGKTLLGSELVAYFLDPLEMPYENLSVPEIERNFLMSPPGSPMDGWKQGKEQEASKGGLPHSMLHLLPEKTISHPIVLEFEPEFAHLPTIVIHDLEPEHQPTVHSIPKTSVPPC